MKHPFKSPDYEAEPRLHYNFVKPHMALEGQTPADSAGIGVQAKDKWGASLEAVLRSDKE